MGVINDMKMVVKKEADAVSKGEIYSDHPSAFDPPKVKKKVKMGRTRTIM
jgi:hypothetical protein